MNKQLAMRMKKELELLECDPPPGIMCWPVEDSLNKLSARIKGPKETPYENGIFQVDVQIPERYPFEPPKAQFVTPIYHPNIDNQGRICLDILKMPPKGSWKPSLNISTMLTSLLVLMSEPNPDDPLLVEVAKEYCENRSMFLKKAQKWTLSYASESNESKIDDSSNMDSTPDYQLPQSDRTLGENLYSLPALPETSCPNAQDASPGKRSLVNLLKKRPRNESSDTSVSSEETPVVCIVKKPKIFSLTTKRKLNSDPHIANVDSGSSKDTSISSAVEDIKEECNEVSSELKPNCNSKIDCTVITSESSEDDEPSTITDDSISQIQAKPYLVEKRISFSGDLAIEEAGSNRLTLKSPKQPTPKITDKNEQKQQQSGLNDNINSAKSTLERQAEQQTNTFEIIELSDSSEEEGSTEQVEKTECTVDIKSNSLTAEVIENESTDRLLNTVTTFKHALSSSEPVGTTSIYFEPATAKNDISSSSLDRNVKQPVKSKRSLLKLKPKPTKTNLV